MKLTDTQLRHVARASHPSVGRGTASDRADPAMADAAKDNIREPDPEITDVMLATEKVMRAADKVIRVAQEVAPGSHTAKTSSSFEERGLGERDRFSLPMTIPRPKRAYRRPLVPSTATLLVVLVSTVVGTSVLLIVERSRSWKVEASQSTSVTISEPGAAKSAGASDRSFGQAFAQTAAPTTQPPPEALPANNARSADMSARPYAAPPANVGLSAAAGAPAPAALPRPNGSPQTAREGERVHGNADVAGNAVGPQAQTQRAGPGAARVATLATRTGGVATTAAQPLTPRQSATSPGTAPGAGASSVRASSDRLATCLAARPAASRLSQEEIAKLFKRGEEYMGEGRISTARLLFQRAAEACDMKAAFALGATYDPIMLKKFGATLLDPNIATARTWYEQARRLGLSEASRQLELLSELPQEQ
jgi:hypothetical protein